MSYNKHDDSKPFGLIECCVLAVVTFVAVGMSLGLGYCIYILFKFLFGW